MLALLCCCGLGFQVGPWWNRRRSLLSSPRERVALAAGSREERQYVPPPERVAQAAGSRGRRSTEATEPVDAGTQVTCKLVGDTLRMSILPRHADRVLVNVHGGRKLHFNHDCGHLMHSAGRIAELEVCRGCCPDLGQLETKLRP